MQENGLFSGRSYMSRNFDLDAEVEDLSLCARISLNYLRGRTSYWLSMGNSTKNDLLVGGNAANSDQPFKNSFSCRMKVKIPCSVKMQNEKSLNMRLTFKYTVKCSKCYHLIKFGFQSSTTPTTLLWSQCESIIQKLSMRYKPFVWICTKKLCCFTKQ